MEQRIRCVFLAKRVHTIRVITKAIVDALVYLIESTFVGHNDDIDGGHHHYWRVQCAHENKSIYLSIMITATSVYIFIFFFNFFASSFYRYRYPYLQQLTEYGR